MNLGNIWLLNNRFFINLKIINLLLILLFLFSPSLSIAKIVYEEGRDCHSDIRKAKELALKNAKKKVVDRYIGELIKAKTLVINGKFIREVIITKSLGNVRLVKVLGYTPEDVRAKENIVCMRVKAKFEIPEEILEKIIKHANFGLTLLLNKKEFKPGEELEIELFSETPCYPYLFSVDATGKVYRLFPNPIEKKTYLLKDKLIFPTEKMKSRGYKLIIIPAEDKKFPQTEEIVFLCTRKKVIALEEYIPCAFAQDEEELHKVLKSYSVTVERFNEILLQIGGDNYDMIDAVYEIVK